METEWNSAALSRYRDFCLRSGSKLSSTHSHATWCRKSCIFTQQDFLAHCMTGEINEQAVNGFESLLLFLEMLFHLFFLKVWKDLLPIKKKRRRKTVSILTNLHVYLSYVF